MARKRAKPMSEARVRELAQEHDNLKDFRLKAGQAYNRAYTLGILDEVTAHMQRRGREWTFERLKDEAALYETRTEFQEKSNKAYQAAVYHNLLDEICSHMGQRRTGDFDSVYILKIDDRGIYKIGVTSARFGLLRVNGLKEKLGRDVSLVLQVHVGENATYAEQRCLDIGTPIPEIHGEARFWNAKELHQAMELLWREVVVG